MTRRPLEEIIDPGWAKALAPVADRIAAAGDFLRAEVAAGRTYLPAGDLVLRAFKQPFEDVRVLIVGQDPYPTPGHPVGLSFSVAPAVRPLPRSLVNIFREYTADLGYAPPATGDLAPWTERGVLLLNRVLTVQPGKPGSHRGKGWEAVTEQAISALARVRAPESDVRRPGLLRLAPVQPGERAPHGAGRPGDRLEAAVACTGACDRSFCLVTVNFRAQC